VSYPETPDGTDSSERRWSFGGTGSRRTLLITGGVLAGAAAFYSGMLVGSAGDVPANTTVLGVQIGGLSQSAAIDVLNTELAPMADESLEITAYESATDASPAEFGLRFDAAATVSAASGRLYNPFAMVQRLFGPVPADPIVVIDEKLLGENLLEFASTVETEPVEPTLTYEGLQPVLEPGEDGRTVDIDAAVDLLADAYLTGGGAVSLPEVPIPPSVSEEQAIAIRDGIATNAVSGPVQVSAGSVTAEVTPEVIAKSLSFEAVDGEFGHVLNGSKLYKSIADQLAPIETPGNNATFQIVNGTPAVVPSKVGEGVADDDLAAAVDSVLDLTGAERVTTAPITVRDPSITTADARTLGVVEEISSFTQQVSYAPYMEHNLALAAEYINGTLLLPGDTFSMNDTTENRDPVDGYMEGYVIGAGGVFDKALGGGISAATTTMWSAAFYAGLEPVEVRAHSIYISRYVPGLEATVAWDYFDMKFRNNTPYGVFIVASTTPTSMTVTMYGTKEYTDIEAEVGQRYGVTNFSTIYNNSDRCAAQSGTQGFTIDVDRVFYQGTEEVARETFTTDYSPSPRVICGEKPKEKDEEKNEEDSKDEETQTPEPTSEPDPPAPEEDGDSDGAQGENVAVEPSVVA